MALSAHGKTRVFQWAVSEMRGIGLIRIRLSLGYSLSSVSTRPIAISRVRREQRPTDGPTDRRTDKAAYRVACTRLKTLIFNKQSFKNPDFRTLHGRPHKLVSR